MVLMCTSLVRAVDWPCSTSAQFQTALTSCNLGDTITLDATQEFIPTGTNFILPKKTTGSGWIEIRSSQMASLPAAGVRISPSNSPNMPKIRPRYNNEPAIQTAKGANHYRLIGLEFKGHASNGQIDGLLELGQSDATQNDINDIAYNIVVDRCYFHANDPVQNMVRAIRLHSKSTDIINCWITDCHSQVHTESQAIHMHNGPGPYNIINNRLEAAGENIMSGGGGAVSIAGVLPSDILIEKNHFIVPVAWRGVYAMKNLLEFKHGRRITVRGNIFENSWSSGQTGVAIVLKVANYNSNNWAVTEDLLFEKNIVRNCGEGVLLQGRDYSNGQPAGALRRIDIKNNLFYNIDKTVWGGAGYFIYTSNGPDDIDVDHNTAFITDKSMQADGSAYPTTNMRYANNLTPHNTYGVFGSGQGTGNSTLNVYYPGINFMKNVLMGGNVNLYNQYTQGWSPTSLGFPGSWSGVLVNHSTPGTNFAGWKVVNGSSWDNTGTDGKDIGCNIDEVVAATAGCISGVWNSPPVTITLKNGVNGYSGSTSFMTKGSAPTSYFGPSQYQNVVNNWGGTNSSGIRSFYKFDVSSIPAGATITSANLRLPVTWSNNPSNPAMSIHRMAPVSGAFTVNYAAATRNSYNGTASTWTGGNNAAGDVANSNNDFVDTPDSTSNLPAGGATGNLNFNVASSIQAWVNGTPNNGWLILTSTATTTVYLGAPADLTGSVDYPELTVTYQP
jgi:hypothetical protein